MGTERNHHLYYEMVEAERVFWNALVDQYGKRAAEFRYQTNELTPIIKALALNYQSSSQRFWDRRVAEVPIHRNHSLRSFSDP